MSRWLAGLLILLVVSLAAAETPPRSPAGEPAIDLEHTLSLLEQVDPQALGDEQRLALYLAAADALLDDGQQQRALNLLAKAFHETPSPVRPGVENAIRSRLEKVATPPLMVALQAGSPLAGLLQEELARRRAVAEAPAIGVVLPLSGRYAPYGEAVRQGLELARTAAPAPMLPRFLYRDSGGDGATAARLVEELAGQPQVAAVIGPLTGGEAAPAAAAAEQGGLPLLLLAPSPGVGGGHVFHCSLTTAAQVQALVDYAVGIGLQRHLIFHPASRTGELFATLFQAAVERSGGQVVASRSYPPGVVDLRQELQALAADAGDLAGVDALFLPDDARQVGQIVPQLGFSRLDQLQLLGIAAWNVPDLVRLAGPRIEGAVFVDGFFAASPSPEVGDFVTSFTAAYARVPGMLAAQGYDVGRLALSVLSRADDRQRQAFRDALIAFRDFRGVTALSGFNASGEAVQSLFLLQVQDGAVVQLN